MAVSRFESRHRAFLAEAQLRYPWQFRIAGVRHDPTEVNVGPGWHDLLRRLFAEVESALGPREREGFRWRRLRAVQGALELRREGGGDLIMPAVVRARDAAAETCEVCGEPGVRRHVRGWFAVECDRHYVRRLLQHHPGGDGAAATWWATPRPELDGRTPGRVYERAPDDPRLLEAALQAVLPAPPVINGAHRQRLQRLWPVLREQFGERLRALRLAEFDGAPGPSGTVLAVVAGATAERDLPAGVTRMARAGFSDLRLRLLSPESVEHPATAADPWSAMLAVHASVPIPRHQPSA
ncbi:hypothetical protein [Sediminicurvatus halobius]|uniref:Uncharacterized protein n=1 Tax=Sediminicurvatus halobius TaxID=2182432 RepID=A0A2U2N1W3_9GAMM|nr:hypothetical protein [Spiribacter halobius]PWG63080.1 hypothetical protein DEM34_09510 [Spiribacter halobius]UEX77528.1 hypothetical protein LMH63_16565 [Spiribacter halobius]